MYNLEESHISTLSILPMKSKNKFSFSSRVNSFSYAFNGLKLLFAEEHNARIHFIIAAVVIIAGWILDISILEWVALVFAIGMVIAFEIVNTAIEKLTNFVSPERHHTIKKVKDLSAGAVLISALSSALVGMFIFVPKLF